jgi:phosphinothricin acetyltransferase
MKRSEAEKAASATIRAAVEADLEAITSIYRHHVLTGTASFELDPPDAVEMKRRFAEIKAKKLPYLIALADGQIAGYAYAGPYRPRPAYRFTVENSIYVHPEMHRRGIGDALLKQLIIECRMRDCKQIIAVIGDSANAGSISLHKKHGFAHVGVLRDVGFKFGRWLDTVFMQLALD